MEEIWKAVKGYEGYYEVSNQGRVRSVDRTIINSRGSSRFYSGKIINQHMKWRGYTCVQLWRKGLGKTLDVQDLVASAFLSYDPNRQKLIVTHINGVSNDNRVKNLKLLTFNEHFIQEVIGRLS